MRRIILGIVIIFLSIVAAEANISLTATNETLEITTTSTSSIDYNITYADHSASGVTLGSAAGRVSAAGTTTVLAAPGASTQRQLRSFRLVNTGGGVNAAALSKDVGGSDYSITASISLSPRESLLIDADGVMVVLDSSGREQRSSANDNGVSGFSLPILKSGSAAEGASVKYLHWKDPGEPGAYTYLSPGMNGVTTDCSRYDGSSPVGAGNMGAHIIPYPSTGSLYITGGAFTASIANLSSLIDILWYNSGISVTTTTLQSISTPTLPARDLDGSIYGRGVGVGLYFVSAATNAAVISNSTVSYTNQNGVSGRTAVLNATTAASIPATPVIGTFVQFQLQNGDTGIKSIEGITLGTSLGSGTVALVLFRPIVSIPIPAPNAGSGVITGLGFGVKIYGGSCIVPMYVPTATTATTLTGSLEITEK